MKIINPLYDKAFKYLMENNKLAKKVLAVILDLEVLEVALSQQETIVPDQIKGLIMYRLDFKAIIREADGSKKTVLIELQKSKFPTDIQRFRNYLGTSYLVKKKENIEESALEEAKPKEYQSIYPIISIYILGYNLDDLPYLAVTVNRDVINSVNKEKLSVTSFFIEHLTHQAHIIQVLRLPPKRKTRLEKFLLLFNQAWSTNQRYILDLQTVPEEFADVASYLQGPLMDDDFRRHLEAEEQLDFIFEEQEARHHRQLSEAIERQEAAEERERVAKEREQVAKGYETDALDQKKALAVKFARQMKKYGATPSAIVEETGLSVEEIEKLKET
jgi:hypothetical protein